ncbi:glycosyltransferase [Pediococcus acidilactici]|uniref:glycosyltransferase n=1 Tax=Pediococcus acidilactici TaxID=1254 RepID=UPI00155EB2E3|nr:glycosyltransferase [Pediococcus acidilactici]NRD14148.1 glycosyltransferase [Pediococcus acidilactici]
MKKIRVALVAGKMVGGGVESLLMSISKYIDKDKFTVDLLVDSDSKIVPKEEIESYGVKLIFIPPYQKIFSYLKELHILFKKNKYDIVHANISALNVFPLAVAYFCNIPVRISHNHNLISPNAGKLKNFLKWVLSYFSNIFPNYRVAPTFETGKWIFKKKPFSVIENGIDSEKFTFSLQKRQCLRNKLGVGKDEILLGSFGRMVHSKNLIVAIKVLEYLLTSSKKQYKLLLIGSGSDEYKLKKYVRTSPMLKENVIFVPGQKDISSYYSALDVYLFPSTAEAFGIAAVEAQTNGLITLVSKGVPSEAKILDVLFNSFDTYDINLWGNFVLNNTKTKSSIKSRNELSIEAKNIVFNSKDMVNKFEELYVNACRKQFGRHS